MAKGGIDEFMQEKKHLAPGYLYKKLLAEGYDIAPPDFYEKLVELRIIRLGKAKVQMKFFYENWDKSVEEYMELLKGQGVDESYIRGSMHRTGIIHYRRFKETGARPKVEQLTVERAAPSEQETEVAVQVGEKPQPRRMGRPPKYDKFILLYPDIKDPGEMVATIRKKHRAGAAGLSHYKAKQRMQALGMEILYKEAEEPEAEPAEPGRAGRKPKIPDEYFLENQGISDPLEMAKAIGRRHRKKVAPAYAKKRMEVLGMYAPKETDREEEERETEREEAATKERRRKIPVCFFKDNPDAEYDGNTLKMLEQYYGVDWKVDRVEFLNRKAELAERLHLGAGSVKRMEPARAVPAKTYYRRTRTMETQPRVIPSSMDAFRNKDWLPNPGDLVRAIMHRTGDKITGDGIEELVHHILNFFGYSIRIIDNVLEPEDRDAFNMLEDEHLLKTEREEITLYDGREWRIHYWLFDVDRILQEANAQREKERGKIPVDDAIVYTELPDDAWQHF